ncbi:RsmD family RNA methyltransferase [Rhizocola hellebori]|nr:methyltransferase [Rhizocola hellebori]
MRRGRPDRGGYPPFHRFEVLYLPGLCDVVSAEVRAALGIAVEPVAQRDDSLQLTFTGRWERLLALRTPVAVFAVLTFAVPRPQTLLSGEHLPAVIAAVEHVRRLSSARPAVSFRFDAAGAGSSVFERIAQQIAAGTRLRYDHAAGDIVLRFRRSVSIADGWDVLIRLSSRPLSHRQWRVRDVPGAANATIAAAMAILSAPRPGDRIANPMCGSGTLMVERLLAGPASACLGFDIDQSMLAASADNLRAAGLAHRTRLLQADNTQPGWTRHGPFDVVFADPPWGTLMGEHSTNETLHLELLRRAREAVKPGARLVFLTHEVRRMERCLRTAEDLWRVNSVTRVFQKGHHPRIYLLTATGSARDDAIE